MPRLTAPGVVICGDAGGMVNVPELKGIHYAMHSGIMAAETIYRSLREDSPDLSAYDRAVRDSTIGKDLYRTRNMRQPFARGFFLGGLITNLMIATGGRLPNGHWAQHRDAESAMSDAGRWRTYPRPDGRYTFDKLSSVYLSGNATRDDAPNHIRVQRKVPRVVAETWAWMCPAGVYEIEENGQDGQNGQNGQNGQDGQNVQDGDLVDVMVNHTNCVQCGAITAKGGRLTVPEGGDGPAYTNT